MPKQTRSLARGYLVVHESLGVGLVLNRRGNRAEHASPHRVQRHPSLGAHREHTAHDRRQGIGGIIMSTPTKQTDRYLSIPEVAERLGTTERFPRRLIEERRIEFKRFGRHVRISERVLTEWIDSCTVPQRRR